MIEPRHVSRHAPRRAPRQRASRRRGWLCAALLAGPLGGAAGCAGFNERPTVARPADDGGYESAMLTYRIDAGRLSVPVAASRIEGQLVSYTEQTSPPIPGSATGELRVHYPHPLGTPGLAQAELILATGPAASSDMDVGWSGWWRGVFQGAHALLTPHEATAYREVWALDIPRAEFDALRVKLIRQGLHEGAEAAAPGIELTLRQDGVVVRKQWSQASELDGLMHRIRNQGQLVSYHRPPSPSTPRSPTSPSGSVAAYEAAFPGPASPASGVSAPSLPATAVQLVRLPTPPLK